MMQPGTRTNPYLKVQVESRTPVELVVLLYDAALRFTEIARDAMVRRDIRTRRDAIQRAMRIIAELQNALDHGRGGTIAKDLDRLYAWVQSRLMAATIEQKVQPIEEAHRVLSNLASAWRTIAAQPPAGAQP